MIGRISLIDSHVHFFDRARPEGVLWPPAGYALPPKASISDLISDAGPQQVLGVVLVEAGSRKSDDNWLLKEAQKDSRVLGVIAHLQPGEAGFEQRIELNSESPKLRGIRLRPIKQYNLNDTMLREHLGHLARFDLSLELGITSLNTLSDYTGLARVLPGIWCGLTHLGHPAIDGEAPGRDWSDAISRFATLPNTFCKFTSLADFAQAAPAFEEPEYYRPWVEFLVEAFGEDRVVFGSNWPNPTAFNGYRGVVDLYRKILGDNGQALEKLFIKNARHIYRLD